MKNNLKHLLTILIITMSSSMLSGCTTSQSNNEGSSSTTKSAQSTIDNSSNSDSSTIVVENYKYDGTKTEPNYSIFNQDGTPFVYTDDKGRKFETYDSMFSAIRVAGKNSTSSNKMSVKDKNGLEIFKRQTKNMYWCYDGEYFVGSKNSTEALKWAKQKTRSYVIDGQGVGNIYCGTNYYPNTDFTKTINLEPGSGGYNYLFTKWGEIKSDVWVKQGYGYCSFNVRLSEAMYRPTKDGDGWNAYIFVNGSANFNCDLGLIGSLDKATNKVVWALVRNCSHTDHKTDAETYGSSFKVLDWTPVTTMSYDKEKDRYTGADDLRFECYQGVNGWNLTITNLKTNKEFKIDENHEGMSSSSTQYMGFLIAASYCPVVSPLWNFRCGAYLKNVLFDDVKIARWNETEKYAQESMEEFYPGSDNMDRGFSHGADCADFVCSTYKNDGTFKSGNTYKKGDRYFSYSCYYDGSHDGEFGDFNE